MIVEDGPGAARVSKNYFLLAFDGHIRYCVNEVRTYPDKVKWYHEVYALVFAKDGSFYVLAMSHARDEIDRRSMSRADEYLIGKK